MKCLLRTFAIKWLLFVAFCLLLTSTMTDAKIYKSCYELRDSSAVDGSYSIELSNGVAVSVYCKGMDTEEPKEYLNLPEGKSKNYAMIYANKGVPNGCNDWKPVKTYNISGKSEFDKVRFDPGTNGIVLDDFTFARKIGLNHVKYGTAGDYFASTKKCPPRGNFRIDLAGTPFIISKKIKWFWEGHFADGTNDSAPILNKNLYIGCFGDKSQRALPAGFMTSKTMTVNRCQSHCKYQGFQYAGVQNGQECWCGNNYKKYGPSRACRMRCHGNNRQICGGPWALSVYVVGEPQFMTGRCGGYPGYCYPAQIHRKKSHLLLLTINPKHPCLKSVCGPFAICLAIDTMGYKCICPKGFTGRNCEKRLEIIPPNGICPPNYQAEICRCAKSDCFGAKFLNGKCVTNGGKPQVVCRYGNPSHVDILTINSGGFASASCPYTTKIISCAYWDPHRKTKGNGVTGPRITYNSCYFRKCRGCSLQVQCMKYMCGCKNNGKCDAITNQCHCRTGYIGELCEDYDYCSFLESSYKKSVCEHGGICRSVPQLVVSTTGGDQAGNRCIFPFNYQGKTFSRCISDNRVGPPFACATVFNGQSSYIDLGKWSPGPAYTILAWVKPTFKDSHNRIIVGSISDCRDFGIGFQYGRFQTYFASSAKDKCTIPISTYNYHVDINKWYAVAVMNTGHIITLMVNGRIWSNSITYSHFLGNAKGFYIGGGPYNYASGFKGNIKNVKIYNRALDARIIDKIFENNGVDDSHDEINNGLVGHYELGEIFPDKCNGIDHGLEDWIPETLSEISGSHCNISKFIIKKGRKVFVMRWDGTSNGSLEVTAKEIHIDGELTAEGAGYHGGQPSNKNGADGTQGESPSDTGAASVAGNQGGGGGGLGQNRSPRGGLPGGGGGHAMAGMHSRSKIVKTGGGEGGAAYGTPEMHYMYLGSGGGSGGNAIDLTQTPLGGAGGNGGGAIKLFADTQVTVRGTINVQGEDGLGDPSAQCFSCPKACKTNPKSCSSLSPSYCWDKSGPGGGGSGGSIYISGEIVNIDVNHLLAMGGIGGRGTNMCGGDGSLGRIHIKSSTMYGRIDRKYGILSRSWRKDKVKDFSHIGHTVGNKGIEINKNPVYLGCIKETKTFLMKHKYDLSSLEARKLTPLFCHKLCSQAGHIYSGTTKGNQCYCDNHVTTTIHAQDKECNSPCPGDKRQFCGGDARVLVFGPKPYSYGKRVIGAMPKCESWCVTADANTAKPKWGNCLDEESTLSMSFNCQCPKGKIGDECDEDCPQGTWGDDCQNNCTCNGNNCDPINGACICQKGIHGSRCDRKVCPKNVIGRDCNVCLQHNHYGSKCQKCDCSNSHCNSRSGECRCSAGRMGKKCERVCPPGKWGNQCKQKCNCYHNATCEPIYGMCDCPSGYAGRKCEERCPTGTYGDRCGLSCPICSTDSCHHVTGYCLCDSGWKGFNCTEPCSPGSWGSGCAKTCNPNCKNGCNPMEGFCCTKTSCSEGQYCDENGNCIGKIKTVALGSGLIVAIVLIVIVIIVCIAVGIMYFFNGKKMFSFMAAKYETQKDNVVLEGHFENPFYERMNDASKPDETEAEKVTNE